jgi:type II secretory pathway component PulK
MSANARIIPRPRGFAAILAITMVGLVAVTLASLGILFAGEARRTRTRAGDVQLRQLLIAGSVAAKQSITQTPNVASNIDIALPRELADNGGQVTLAIQPNGEKTTVLVKAKFENRRAEETLHFTRDGAAWKLSRVDLQTASGPLPP